MLYNSAKQQGFLYHALNYNQYQKRKAEKSPVGLKDGEELWSMEEKEEILAFFKRCVLPQQRNEVEKKMAETKAFRRHVILNDFQEYAKCWQFYFVAPDLVSVLFVIERLFKHFFSYQYMFSDFFRENIN